MALEILYEWRLGQRLGAFRDWLAQGAPSDDSSERASKEW